VTKRRIIKWLGGLSGLCVILLFAIALILPRILDSQPVKEKIRAFLLAKTNENVAFEKIDLVWLPRPTLVVHGASLSVADEVSGKIGFIEVYPSIWGLLSGRLDISRVEAVSPAVAVRLPEPAEGAFNIDEIESKIRSIITTLGTEIPGIAVTVRGGSAEIKIGNRPPVILTDFDGRLKALPDDLDFQISSRANVFESLHIEGNIAAATLATQGRMKIERLNLRESIAALWRGPPEYVESGDLTLEVGLTSTGLKKIKTEINGTLPSLGLVRGNRKTVVEGSSFKAAISRDEGIVNAIIDRLDVASPRLAANGELTLDPASSSRLKLAGKELDVSQIRDWALKIAGDIEVVEYLFRHVKGGKIPEISFQTAGRSFDELWKTNNMAVTGTLRDGNIIGFATGSNLEEVSGPFVVSRGVLEANQFSARLGKIQGRDGVVRVGLEGKSAPFHLDMMVQADATELRSLLLRVVENEDFRKEVSKLRDVKGNLSGRLILGERIDSILPKVSILKAAISGSYDPIPYPISVKEGRFQYGDGKIALDSVSGTVGLSSFSEVTGSLSYSGARQIEVESGRFSLDVAQTSNLLNRFAVLPKGLRDVDFTQGRLDLIALSLKGPLDQPSQWDFSSTGSVSGIAVKHANLPGVMNVSGGSLSATPAKLTVSDAKVNLLDASVTVEGFLQGFNEAPLSLDATATGAIGGEVAGWLSRQIELPKELMLRSPLQVTKGHVLWKEGGDVAFQGDLTVAGGPRLSLDLVRAPQTVEVKEILIADGEQRARMTFDIERDKFALSFNGALEQKTLNQIFQAPPLEASLIQGDIEVSAFLEEPHRFTARGRLAGKELRVPLKDEHAIVEFFFLEADPNGLNLRSANLRWRDSRLSFMGKLLAEPKALRLDMDVSADQVVWEEFDQLVNRGSKGGDNSVLGRALPPLEGTVRLKADRFTLAGFSSSPFQAVASLSQNTVNVQIKHADVCGIATVGNVDVASGEIGLDVSFSVTGGQLESTSSCLSDNKQAIKGNYSLTGRLSGRGTPEKIAQTLRGDFDFSARDGEILQSPTVDTPLEAAFNYLNNTGDFSLVFPDLDKESFPFRLISSRGTVQGTSLVNDEVTLLSSLYTIAGTGRIDFEHKQIDARGLVSVLLPGDRFIRRIPVVGSFLAGSIVGIVGIPIRLTGSLEHPDVTYLAPKDVGAELLRIPVRILGLPLEAIRLFTPNVPELEWK
jgi:AsmA-like C-terminal region